MDALERAFEYYLKHQDELVKTYEGKFIAIADDAVVGAFDDEKTAIEQTQKDFPLGTFLVQRVSSGDTAYSQTYHSRVAFA